MKRSDFEKIPNDTYFWAKTIEGHVYCCVKENGFIFIAGNWEGDIPYNTIVKIETINKPSFL